MTQDTNTASGAADLPEALTVAVDCWFAKNTGLGGCSDKDVRELADIFRLHALAAGQATAAQQGVAYAELPDEVVRLAQVATRECQYKGNDMPQDWMESAMRACRLIAASHGQASAQAGEYPALVCDYCGALTPDPWHSSGMLHGKMSKHIHSCDACAARGVAKVQAAKQQEQLI